MRENKETQAQHYVAEIYASEDSLLGEIKDFALKDDFPIHIRPEEGRLIQVLMKSIRASNVLEIGTHFGYSSLWLSRALPENGRLYTVEHDSKRAEYAQSFINKSEVSDKIILINEDAKKALESFETEFFDFIFIDGDKPSYNFYLDWADTHLRSGGILVADNTFLSGAVYTDGSVGRVRKTTLESMKAFNLSLARNDSYTSVIIPTSEGLTVALKK